MRPRLRIVVVVLGARPVVARLVVARPSVEAVIILVVVVAVHTVSEIDPSDPLNISSCFTWELDQA